ncbi:MAG: hypothetical protein HWE30_17725 [Methylocystaceae bacterium]|nr:hypothetical protein [Methylocystaceae bacterium]
MNIEKIEKEPFTVPDEMLARGVPILYVDERCTEDDLMIMEQPDGQKFLVRITDEGPQKVETL